MYDYFEFLGRGIIASRTQRYQEAHKYLKLAAGLVPASPRPWLWLAASSERAVEQEYYLEQALQRDASLDVARVLLDRLQRRDEGVAQPADDFVIFSCPSCGGRQHFDPDVVGLVCQFCRQVEHLRIANVADASLPLDEALKQKAGNWSAAYGVTHCQRCGAQITMPAEYGKQTCAYCGSEKITLQAATPHLTTPQGFAPFCLTDEDVLNRLAEYWHTQAARLQHLLGKGHIRLTALYLPFWVFDGQVQILCAFDYPVAIREYSRHERVIRKGIWPKETCWFETEIDNLMIYAGQILKVKEVEQLQPFDLNQALEYHPQILAGWQAELYRVALEDAAIAGHKKMRDEAFRRAARHLLFIEPSRLLQHDLVIQDKTFQLILLPVWIARRLVEQGVEQVVINGQSGTIGNKKRGRMMKKLKDFFLS